MKKPQVYFDAFVNGVYFDEEFNEYSSQLFELIDSQTFLGYCSDFVIEEIKAYQG